MVRFSFSVSYEKSTTYEVEMVSGDYCNSRTMFCCARHQARRRSLERHAISPAIHARATRETTSQHRSVLPSRYKTRTRRQAQQAMRPAIAIFQANNSFFNICRTRTPFFYRYDPMGSIRYNDFICISFSCFNSLKNATFEKKTTIV